MTYEIREVYKFKGRKRRLDAVAVLQLGCEVARFPAEKGGSILTVTAAALPDDKRLQDFLHGVGMGVTLTALAKMTVVEAIWREDEDEGDESEQKPANPANPSAKEATDAPGAPGAGIGSLE